MPITAQAVREMAPKVAASLSGGPAITPNLSKCDLFTAIAIMLVLICRGRDTEQIILAYFARHNCPHSDDTLRFVLGQFEGVDKRLSLWRVDKFGSYELLDDHYKTFPL